jgi:hypothetical protein
MLLDFAITGLLARCHIDCVVDKRFGVRWCSRSDFMMPPWRRGNVVQVGNIVRERANPAVG